MSWLELPRRPEPEVMDDASEVGVYVSATASPYLEAIDNTFVEQVLSLGVREGFALDVGAGPGQIALKLARRIPGLHFVGVDKSASMVTAARRASREQGLENRVCFCLTDAQRLSFPDACFALVFSNSVLHHLPYPVEAFNEMARVTRPGGMVLIRDLRRPARLVFRVHVGWHGRHYSGKMKELYEASVRAAYSKKELSGLMKNSALARGCIFRHHRTHLGILWKKS